MKRFHCQCTWGRHVISHYTVIHMSKPLYAYSTTSRHSNTTWGVQIHIPASCSLEEDLASLLDKMALPNLSWNCLCVPRKPGIRKSKRDHKSKTLFYKTKYMQSIPTNQLRAVVKDTCMGVPVRIGRCLHFGSLTAFVIWVERGNSKVPGHESCEWPISLLPWDS